MQASEIREKRVNKLKNLPYGPRAFFGEKSIPKLSNLDMPQATLLRRAVIAGRRASSGLLLSPAGVASVSSADDEGEAVHCRRHVAPFARFLLARGVDLDHARDQGVRRKADVA